jgi:hypothetical protein
MKNIHIIPTEKPSRLYKRIDLSTFHLGDFDICKTDDTIRTNQNIYITSDEKIKEGFVTDGESVFKVISNNFNTVRLHDKHNNLIKLHESRLSKIILTTDQDLIKDGVQSIDDTFLEWFIKNPTCEFVKIHKEKQHIGEEIDESYPKGFFDYKIIIPQEEPKQETLEEAAEKYKYNPKGDFCFTKGAKWQQERMYSEEDMKLSFETGRNFQLTGEDNFNELIEQFKKK